MTFHHKALRANAPLSSDDLNRLSAIETKTGRITDWERGELRAMSMRADEATSQRIQRIASRTRPNETDVAARFRAHQAGR